MEEYQRKRKQFEQEIQEKKYAGLTFTPLEDEANQLYRELLVKERSTKPDSFYKSYTQRHMAEFKKESRIFEAVQKLPKGAVLHIHIDCCMDIDWFMSDLAYHENSYFNHETSRFKYFNTPDAVEEGYRNLKQERDSHPSPEEFDSNIRRILFLQEEERMSPSNIWEAFEKKVMATGGLIYFKNHFKNYLRRYLQNFINDGVLHIEARSFLNAIFNEDGSMISLDEEAQMINEIVQELQVNHPHFTFLLIIQGLKVWDLPYIEKYMKDALLAKKAYPNLICGFDLVQEEDAFKTLNELAPVLIKMKELQAEVGVELPLVLHSGESLHSITNSNLYDALLLGTKRIGHGLNLSQHSGLLEKIKQDEVCLEICPVSNQVLKYIDDIRLHPIKTFINYGVKVSINPDDPGFFGYNGVSMDFFFVTIGTQLDFKDLKLCAYNSIKYSFLTEEKKASTWAETDKRIQEWAAWFIQRNGNIQS